MFYVKLYVHSLVDILKCLLYNCYWLTVCIVVVVYSIMMDLKVADGA